MSEKTNVNLRQVAALAGVDISTVSRALADSPLVKESTRERIKQIAAEAGFVANQSARNLKLGKSGTIAIVLTTEVTSAQSVSDSFILEMMGVIIDSLADRGFNALVSRMRFRTAKQFMNDPSYRSSEGLIVIGQGGRHRELNVLARTGKPMIVWGNQVKNCAYPIVGSNNEVGGLLATEHLINVGRKRIAFVGDKIHLEVMGRYLGYRRALERAGLPYDKSLELAAAFDTSTGRTQIRKFLSNHQDVDGLMCCSDLLAIASITVLQEMGLTVPKDVSVTGYDNIMISEYVFPPLTTISQNMQKGGRNLVEGLMRLLQGKRCEDQIAASELIVRSSSIPS